MQPSPTRNNSIDNVRLLAIFGIIVMHAFPFFFVPTNSAVTLGIVLNQLTRFGVPCFFVISGYLFAQRAAENGVLPTLRKSASRLLMLYAFWCVFYVLPYDVVLINENDPQGHITFARFHLLAWTSNAENFLLGGSKAHLWFLPALLCAMTICAPFVATRKYTLMLTLCAALFATGLFAGPYQNTLVPITLPINVRNGPIFSPIFFAIGVMLAGIEVSKGFVRTAVVLTVVGAVAQLIEVFFLIKHGYKAPYPLYPDYLVSTLALGTGPAMLAISGRIARHNKAWLWGLGRYTLGIYALHFFVMDFFIPINNALRTNWTWQALSPLLYFALTAALVALLARVRRLRPLIS